MFEVQQYNSEEEKLWQTKAISSEELPDNDFKFAPSATKSL